MKSREIGRTGLHVTPLGFGAHPWAISSRPIAEADASGTVGDGLVKWLPLFRYRALLRLWAQRAAHGRWAAASIRVPIMSCRRRSAG